MADPKQPQNDDAEAERPTGDHEHEVKPGEELLYAQKYGMAWNPADHERLGMNDFERDYGQDPLDTAQEYRTTGKPDLAEDESKNEQFDPLAEEDSDDAISATE